MARNIIDLPTLGDDGRLYRDTALDLVESLIPNPWKSCHAPDLLELENGDLLCCWFAGSREGNADISIAVARLPADAEQWEQPVIVSDDPTRSEQNPSLFQMSIIRSMPPTTALWARVMQSCCWHGQFNCLCPENRRCGTLIYSRAKMTVRQWLAQARAATKKSTVQI